MKKRILFFLLLLISWQSKAQFEDPAPTNNNQFLESQIKIKYNPEDFYFLKSSYNKTNEVQTHLVNFGKDCATNYMLAHPTANESTTLLKYFDVFPISIFPDSTVIIKAQTKSFHVNTHKLGVVIDPTSPIYLDSLDKFTPYTIDSIWFPACYNVKNAQFSIHPDTLMVEVVWAESAAKVLKDNNTFEYIGYSKTSLAPARNSDIILNAPTALHGNPGGVKAPALNRKIIKRVLSSFDSVPSGKIIPFIIHPGLNGIPIPAGSIVGLSVSFIPGYSHQANDIYLSDDNSSNLNSLRGIYYYDKNISLNNKLTYAFVDENTTGHFSASQFLSSASRYGSYSPTLAYLNNFLPDFNRGLELGFFFHADITGIPENSNNGLKLAQNIPNPFNGNTTIEYSIKESSSVKLEIVDITGKKLMTLDEGKKSAGNHYLIINADQLNSGLYFYTLTANGNRLTRKMNIIN